MRPACFLGGKEDQSCVVLCHCSESPNKEECSLCEEVGFVKGVHLLSGDVRSVTTALKVVEEAQEEVQEVEDEWGDEEDEENGGLKVEEIRSLHVWI